MLNRTKSIEQKHKSSCSSFSNDLGIASKSNVISPQEDALQSLCKRLLRARVFRGFYEERRFVETVSGYRDIVILQRTERELEKLLLEIRHKLYMFYQDKPHFWIGITHNMPLTNALRPHAITTGIWTELEDIAFGQYWFIIKTVRFRDDEIFLKLKMVREIEPEFMHNVSRLQRLNASSTSAYSTPTRTYVTKEGQKSKTSCNKENLSPKSKSATTTPTKCQLNQTISKVNSTTPNERVRQYSQTEYLEKSDPKINYQDFVEVIQMWGNSIKHTLYNFMANDVSKDNIKAIVRFIGLIVITLITAAIGATKFLGIFTLRFMHEASRLTHALTPIVFKIIDVFNKMIGGFYILLTMIWKDAIVHRNQQPINIRNIKPIEYNIPRNENAMRHHPRFVEFERKFQ